MSRKYRVLRRSTKPNAALRDTPSAISGARPLGAARALRVIAGQRLYAGRADGKERPRIVAPAKSGACHREPE